MREPRRILWRDGRGEILQRGTYTMKKYAAVVFDLDGTLLNTLQDLQSAVNHTMSVLHCPPRTLDEVRLFAGNGIRKLVERSLPADKRDAASADRAFSVFCAYYAAHTADKTLPYPGVREMIGRLRAGGLRLAVVSNKAEFAVRTLCDRFFPAAFSAVVGARENVPKKPDPTGVRAALAELSVTPSQALYVGDSDVDAETAKNAGMDCALVSWGFRDRAILEAEHPILLADDAAAVADVALGTGKE